MNNDHLKVQLQLHGEGWRRGERGGGGGEGAVVRLGVIGLRMLNPVTLREVKKEYSKWITHMSRKMEVNAKRNSSRS